MSVEESEDGKEDGRVSERELRVSGVGLAIIPMFGELLPAGRTPPTGLLDLRLTIPGRRRDWLTCGRAPQ